MAYYKDLREHMEALDKEGLLLRVQREINKDTELMPLVRWQFRGLPEEERKAFLFENVTDAKGKNYDIPVVVGAYAATRRICAMGLGCEPKDLLSRWENALSHPLEPVFVSDAPAQEEVYTGEELTRVGGGLDAFPIPISTPGFDCAPYTTCSCLVTKDIDTGIQNVGNYRGQIKARNRIGMNIKPQKDAVPHWRKCKDKGIPMEFALVIGPPPAVAATGVSEVPRGVDEHTIAGGLVGEPIPVVKCKTVDLFVPADSELVLEGLISTEYMEPEAPFGESHGYMNPRELGYILDIKAITHRKSCIFAAWISEVTPSESSAIKRDAYEALFLRYLKTERRISSVTKVMMHEPLTNLRKLIVIQMKKPSKEHVWRALYSATQFEPRVGKIIIAVDEDIDPEDMDAVLWAMSYRMKPHEDVNIVPYRDKGHGPPFLVSETEPAQPSCNDSALLIDATLKEPFPPVSLPKREFMERAKQIWEELGLPKLKPQSPWFGYSLGQWSEEWDEEAKLAVEGEHYATGEKLLRRRVRV